jgi:hypothetical protein
VQQLPQETGKRVVVRRTTVYCVHMYVNFMYMYVHTVVKVKVLVHTRNRYKL